MENIDDLMRQKFDSDDPGERFEFREEYWEQAQALLEQDEERRRYGFWWVIGLLLALLLLVWFGWAFGHQAGLSDAGGPIHTPNTVLSEQDQHAASNAYPGATETNGTAPNAPASANKQSGLAQSDENNKSQNTLGAAKHKSASRNKSKNQKEVQFHHPYETAAYGLKRQRLQEKGAQSNIGQSNALDAPNPGSAPNNEGAALKDPVPTTEGTVLGQAPLSSAPYEPTAVSPAPQISLDILPTPLKPLSLPSRALPKLPLQKNANEPIASNPQPVPSAAFSWGFALSGAAYPAQDTLGRWAGWTAGVFGEYRMTPHWTLSIGGQWRFLPGYGVPSDTSNPDNLESLRYSFGYKRESWKRETQGLHYLEFPISARWNRRRWGLEGGAVWGKLLSVQTRTEYTTESSLEAAQTTIKKFVKGDTAPYAKNYFAAFTGAEYRFNKRLSLMARGQYRFTPVLIEAPDGAKNKGLGNVELGLRFRLF